MFFLKLISRLPLQILYFFSPIIYFFLYRILAYRKEVVLSNISLAFPENTKGDNQSIMKAFYIHLSYVLVEIIKLLTISINEYQKRCTYTLSEDLKREIEKGQPFIMTGTHIGNWEYYVYAPTLLLGIPLDTLYKPIKNTFFDKMMYTIRSRFEMEPMPMKTALRDIIKKKGLFRVYGFASDQSPQKSQIEYYHSFFGIDTPFYTGISKVARKFQYPIMYIVMRRIKKGYYDLKFDLLASPPYDEKTTKDDLIMKEYIKRIERDIKNDPSMWLWSHRRWKHAKF